MWCRVASKHWQAGILLLAVGVGLIHILWVEAIWAAAIPAAPQQAGQGPSLNFDVGQVVECIELAQLPDPSWLTAKPAPPSSQLMLIPLNVSTNIERDDVRRQLKEVRIEIRFRERGAEIFDYFPQTTSVPDVDGPINVEEIEDRNASLNLNVSGAHEMVRANAGLGGGHSQKTIKRYAAIPEQNMVSATGTLDRRNGVYFKFLASAHVPWDAERQLILVAKVPRGWRSGLLQVDAWATGQRRALPGFDSDYLVRRQRFFVSYCAAGDGQAYEQAARMMETYAIAAEQLSRASQATRGPLGDLEQLLSGPAPAEVSPIDLQRWLVTGRQSAADNSSLAILPVGLKSRCGELVTARQDQLRMNFDSMESAKLAQAENGGDSPAAMLANGKR